jgi:hypothetical protein
MHPQAALFIFLAATVVAVFAFLSVAVWVNGPSQDRQARDRMELLKTLAENPNENAARVLDVLQAEDRRRREKAAQEERKGYIVGGLIAMASGTGLALMLWFLKGGGVWSVGLIPLLIGVVLLGIGIFTRTGRPGQQG